MMPALRQYLELVRQQGLWYLTTLALSLGLGVASWYIWREFGADQTLPARDLWLGQGLAVLNLGLSIYSLPREPFASYLLLGTTLIFELLIIVFVYLA